MVLHNVFVAPPTEPDSVMAAVSFPDLQLQTVCWETSAFFPILICFSPVVCSWIEHVRLFTVWTNSSVKNAGRRCAMMQEQWLFISLLWQRTQHATCILHLSTHLLHELPLTEYTFQMCWFYSRSPWAGWLPPQTHRFPPVAQQTHRLPSQILTWRFRIGWLFRMCLRKTRFNLSSSEIGCFC